MKIAFDARSINTKPAGIGVYLINLATNLAQDGHQVSLLSYTDQLAWQPTDLNIRIKHIPLPVVGDDYLNKLAWQEVSLKKLIEQEKPDVYHGIANRGIPAMDIPSVMTIHDVIQLLLPNDDQYYFYRYIDIGLSASRAKRVICISENTKRDVLKFFPKLEPKISVEYNGVPALASSAPNPHADKAPYIVYNGGFGLRKNIPALVEAFALFRSKHPTAHLVLLGAAGAGGQSDDPMLKATREAVTRLGVTDSVVFAGYVERAEMGSIIGGAFCSVLPTHYEGFGFPIIEAMSVGCPVIAADNSSLPEIVGKAGLLVNENKPPEIAKAIEKMYSDTKFRQRMIVAGHQNTKRFTQERLYTAMLEIYRSCTL